MSFRKSTKIVIVIAIIALVASMIGVIPSSKTSAESTYTFNDLEVDEILYPGETISLSDSQHVLFVLEKDEDFESISDFEYESNYGDKYIIASTVPAQLNDECDAWKVRFIREMTDSGYATGVYYAICEPVKTTKITKQPQNVNIIAGETASFSISTEKVLNDEKDAKYQWVRKIKEDLKNFNYTQYSSFNISFEDTLVITTKSIFSFKYLYNFKSSFSYCTVRIVSDDSTFSYTDNLNRNETGEYNNSVILTPGNYKIEYTGYLGSNEENDNFSVIDTSITELKTVENGNVMKIDSSNVNYINGTSFSCLVNDSLLSDSATLTINPVPEPQINPAKLEKVHAPTKTYYLKKNQTMTLPVYAYKTDGTKEKLTFTSSNKKIATVNKKTGKIKAKKTGTVTITAKAASGTKYKFKIKVTKKATKVKKLTMSGAPKSMNVGDKKYLSLKVTPKKATKAVAKWTSNNKSVITVDKTGRIVAKKAGKAKITAKIGKKKVTKTITVK